MNKEIIDELALVLAKQKLLELFEKFNTNHIVSETKETNLKSIKRKLNYINKKLK